MTYIMLYYEWKIYKKKINFVIMNVYRNLYNIFLYLSLSINQSLPNEGSSFF